MFTSLRIHGLRGFATEQVLQLAVPNGEPGSGLTILVGANNSGKSTSIEAFQALGQRQAPTFTQGRRNLVGGDTVRVVLADASGDAVTLASAGAGTSEATLVSRPDVGDVSRRFLVLPSRRAFNPHFGKSEINREDYMVHLGFPAIRSSTLDPFAYRLFKVAKHRAAFDAVLKKVVDPVPDWSIDQMDSGQYFVKVRKGGAAHSSEGLGEGLLSLLFIVDALYDSGTSSLIAIDEPELSLHPALQRKLAALLLEYSKDRQIVIATHSPYLVRLDALEQGATIARVHQIEEGSVISQLTSGTAKSIFGLLRNQNNPHILGTNAQEIFFVQDQVVLTEGQEDVVFLERVQESLGTVLNGNLFGWGVGGAENMGKIALVLRELGYKRVVGVLDGNRAASAAGLATHFPEYHFFAIAADDIRTKDAVVGRPRVEGLLDDKNKVVRDEHRADTTEKFAAANAYLAS